MLRTWNYGLRCAAPAESHCQETSPQALIPKGKLAVLLIGEDWTLDPLASLAIGITNVHFGDKSLSTVLG